MRIIIYKENDTWVAQGIDVDIGCQASDLRTLGNRLKAVAMFDKTDAVPPEDVRKKWNSAGILSLSIDIKDTKW